MNRERNMAAPPDGTWMVTQEALNRASAWGESSREGEAGNRLDMAAISRAMVHWRWLIAGTTLAGLVLGVIATLLMTPLYRATVMLEVNPPTVEVSDSKNAPQPQSGGSGIDLVATQVGLLKSRSIAERAVRELDLGNNPNIVEPSGDAKERFERATDVVASGTNVSAPEVGTLISFSFTSRSPELAAAVANQIADSFISSGLQRRYDASTYARKFLGQQINKTRGDLEKSERQLVNYAQSQGIINIAGPGKDGASPGDVSSLQGESLVALNEALGTATAKRVQAESAYREGTAVGATTDVTSSTAAFRGTRAGLQAEYQQKRTLMKPEHPDMLSLQSQINEIDRQIARETSRVFSSRSNTLLADYRSAASAERALQTKVASLKASVLNLRGRSIEYNILQRDADTNRTLYDALLQRYKEVGVTAGIGSSSVSIVDHAKVPREPFRPIFYLNLIIGILAGLGAGAGIAIALDIIYDTIKTREDVRVKLFTACLGAIPKVANGEFSNNLKDSRSEVSEAYASVLASLRFSTNDGLPRTLMITSTSGGEGKSSSSLAIARNLARLGNQVLLVDGDLRKPVFRATKETVGLTHILTGEALNTKDHICPTQFDNLYLLPAGPIPPNPADLLSSGRTMTLLRELETYYDFVVLDAPPVLGLADALLLASVATKVLFVVESGQTRTKAALESLKLVRSTGAQVVGAVLTKATGDDAGYDYYSYNRNHERKSLRKPENRDIIMFPSSAYGE